MAESANENDAMDTANELTNGFYAVNENNEKTSGPFETYREASEACGPNEAVFSEREFQAVKA